MNLNQGSAEKDRVEKRGFRISANGECSSAFGLITMAVIFVHAAAGVLRCEWTLDGGTSLHGNSGFADLALIIILPKLVDLPGLPLL